MLLESLLFLVFNVLFIRVISQAVWNVVYKRAKRSFDNNLYVKQIFALFISLVVASIEIKFFLSFQQPNYYQLYGLQRNFSNQELKVAHKRIVLQNHPDKNPDIPLEQFYLLKQINKIFSNEYQKFIYDSFGEFKEPLKDTDWENTVLHFQNQHQVSFVLFFMISLLMVLIQTFHRELRPIRIKAMILIGVFAYNEWCTLYDQTHPVFLAIIFRDLTLNQLVRMQRIIMTVFIVCLVFYQRCLTRGMEWTQCAIEFCKQQLPKNQDIVVNVLQEVLLNIQELKKQGEEQVKSQNSRLQRIINGLVIFVMIVFAVQQILLN